MNPKLTHTHRHTGNLHFLVRAFLLEDVNSVQSDGFCVQSPNLALGIEYRRLLECCLIQSAVVVVKVEHIRDFQELQFTRRGHSEAKHTTSKQRPQSDTSTTKEEWT